MNIKCEIREIEQQSTTNKPNEYSLCIWGTGTEVQCRNIWRMLEENEFIYKTYEVDS